MDLTAISRGSVSTGYVATDESTSSVAYVDLATTGPSFTRTVNTAMLFTVSCQCYNTLAATNTAFVSLSASGANTIASGTHNAAQSNAGISYSLAITCQWQVTGLAAGSTTFKVQYRVDGSTFRFFKRALRGEAID